jgi:hypothetical protein
LSAAVAHRDEELVVVAVRTEVDLVDRVKDVVEILILQEAALERGRPGDDFVLVEGVRAVDVGGGVEEAVGLVVGMVIPRRPPSEVMEPVTSRKVVKVCVARSYLRTRPS